MFSGKAFQTGIILASGSPRRAELLRLAHLPFRTVVSGAEELGGTGFKPDALARENAAVKARSVAGMIEPEAPVVGCDTVVSLGEQVFGKPKDAQDALRMLTALSGKTHEVISGVCITDGVDERVFSVLTRVTFRQLGEDVLLDYVKTGECSDKAGAYAIQGVGMLLVDEIEGDYPNVVGLPVARLVQELEAFLISHPMEGLAKARAGRRAAM